MEQAHQRVQDSVWMPVVREFADLPPSYNLHAAYARYASADTVAWDEWSDQVPAIRAVLTPLQFSLVPDGLRGVLLAKRREYKFFFDGHGGYLISRFN